MQVDIFDSQYANDKIGVVDLHRSVASRTGFPPRHRSLRRNRSITQPARAAARKLPGPIPRGAAHTRLLAGVLLVPVQGAAQPALPIARGGLSRSRFDGPTPRVYAQLQPGQGSQRATHLRAAFAVARCLQALPGSLPDGRAVLGGATALPEHVRVPGSRALDR
jgi:hypothetical protein